MNPDDEGWNESDTVEACERAIRAIDVCTGEDERIAKARDLLESAKHEAWTRTREVHEARHWDSEP